MIKRLNKVDEVAAMALLLASDFGRGITGAVLSVDGGSSSY
jgi:enoyl-[acyl-carrier-protein] reductase (NADH)